MLWAFSVNGVPIRLTKERIKHIYTGHPEVRGKEDAMLRTINSPDFIQKGDMGTLLAVKRFAKTPVERNKYLVVVYREVSKQDGFVLTAYYTSNPAKREIIWKKQ
jgi:hypothetical protein